MFSVIRDLRQGAVVRIKKNSKSHDKGLERRKWKSIKSFFSEETKATKALLKGR